MGKVNIHKTPNSIKLYLRDWEKYSNIYFNSNYILIKTEILITQFQY